MDNEIKENEREYNGDEEINGLISLERSNDRSKSFTCCSTASFFRLLFTLLSHLFPSWIKETLEKYEPPRSYLKLKLKVLNHQTRVSYAVKLDRKSVV